MAKKILKKASSPKKTFSLSEPNRSEMKKWEIESAMSTLQRAVEIQKNSKLMADVKKMAAEKVKELNNIAAGKMK